MIRTYTIVLILCIGSTCFAADESQEPPLKYTLEINGQGHELVLDKPVKLQGEYSNPKVVLRASSIRHYTYGDITFQYPASFAWEAEIEGHNEKTWILSGNDFKIMYFILPDVLSVEAYSQAMAKQYGKGSTRISDTERELGGQRHNGKLLFVKLAGTTLSLEVYSLPAKTGPGCSFCRIATKTIGQLAKKAKGPWQCCQAASRTQRRLTSRMQATANNRT